MCNKIKSLLFAAAGTVSGQRRVEGCAVGGGHGTVLKYIYTHTHTHTHTYTHAHTRAHTHIYMYVCVCAAGHTVNCCPVVLLVMLLTAVMLHINFRFV